MPVSLDLIPNGQETFADMESLIGTGTTALVLTTAIYYLNAQPELWKELQAILLEKFPNASAEEPDIVELEKIQLLEACVKESMRVSVPIRGRFPRDVPEGGLSIHGFHVPQGVCYLCQSRPSSVNATDTRDSLVYGLFFGLVLLL